jgi:non-specific serine/threonine protein kinase
LTILITSRERLNVNGEWSLNIGGLGVPPESAADQIEDYSAVRLFVQSAQRVRAGFSVRGSERACVARLCRLVDGMPLALELAAVWTRTLSCREIAQEVESGLAILATPQRNASERHCSMQVVFNQSWKLLANEERCVLCRLSVFRGGFERHGAQVVADASLPVLAALVDKSFLHQDEAGRYRVHELVRQYAGEKLRESGEMEEARNRHLAFFLELAAAAESKMRGPEQVNWLQRLERDHNNLRAALDWGLAAQSIREAGLRLSSMLVTFWLIHGYFQEGQRWLEQELTASGDVIAALRAKALTGLGTMAWCQGDFTRATAFHQDSLKLYQMLDDTRGIAEALNNLGVQAYYQGDLRQAMPHLQESLKFHRALGDKAGTALALINLGEVARHLGDPEWAAARYSEGLALYRELGDQRWIAGALHNLGLVATDQGDFERALQLHQESLLIFQCLGEKQALPESLEALADVFGVMCQPQPAAQLLGAAAALREVLQIPLPPVDRNDYEHTLTVARAQLDNAMFESAWARGRSMTIEQAIDYALTSNGGG